MVDNGMLCKALSEVADLDLRHACMVRTLGFERGSEWYFCMGKHGMNLVRGKMDSPCFKTKIPYRSLRKVVIYTSTEDMFELLLGGNDLPVDCVEERPCPERLIMRSAARQDITSRLQMYWKTDHMFTHWEFPSGELFERSARSASEVVEEAANAQGGPDGALMRQQNDLFVEKLSLEPTFEATHTHPGGYQFWLDQMFSGSDALVKGTSTRWIPTSAGRAGGSGRAQAGARRKSGRPR